MTEAERFGSNRKTISDLTIQPNADYLLAAPSVPDETRQVAIEKAEAGETITTKVAKEIVGEARRRGDLDGGRRSLPTTWGCG